jgi:Uncharacterised nucleotidyltransferase
VLAALHLSDPRPDLLAGLNEQQWEQALWFADRSQLTLAWRRRAHEFMPQWMAEITNENLAHNRLRLSNTVELYRLIGRMLAENAVPFAALKGIAHCPLFTALPEDRPQHDVDLYVPRENIAQARDLLLASGYESLEGVEHLPTDHIPALVRKTGWEFRGDFFDPDMPLPVEVHFRFWNGDLECLPAPGTEEFWQRRTAARIPGTDLELPTLAPPDALAFASLHYLKHVLRGSGRPFHAYEIACFLEAHATDEAFWREWRALHSPELRRLQAVVFRLAAEWFGCRTAPAQEEIDRLPKSTQTWFAEFGLSPARRLFESRKDELWLHLSLLGSAKDRRTIARRRLLPVSLPHPVQQAHVPAKDLRGQALQRRARYVAHIASRLRHHAVALLAAAKSGARWWWRTR